LEAKFLALALEVKALALALTPLALALALALEFVALTPSHFSEIQDGGSRHLGFSGYANLVITAC